MGVLIWFYRTPPWMWTTHFPAYGDVLEAIWQTDFWRDAVLNRSFDPVSPVAMYPLGMHQMVLAHIGTGLLLLPISLATGSGVAVNIGFVGGLIVCFLGGRAFLKHFTDSPLLASIGATLLTFALGRTLHIHFHLNVALASTAGVWMAAMLMELRRRLGERRAWMWAIGSGICWGIAIIAQPYFVFLAVVLLLILGIQWRAWKYVPLIPVSALLTSGLFLLGVAQGTTYMASKGTSLQGLTAFSSVPGSYLGWSRLSVWKELANLTAPWRQNFSEADIQNWGVLAALLAIPGIILVWRSKSRRALILVLGVAAILSFGPLWRAPLQSDLLKQLNESIWQIGAQLKPELFSEFSASLKNDSVPLPGMLPVMLLPRYEFARVAGRYSIWVGLAVVALGLITLNRLPKRWAIVIGCVWVIELLPIPRQPQLLPTQPHPAHEWAAQQVKGQDWAVYSPPGMEYIYSHYLAGNLPGANVNGPFPPAHLRFTHPWITFRNTSIDPLAEALTDPAQAVILRRAQVRFVLLRPEAVELARQNSALRFIRCFEPDPVKLKYYHSPLCAFEVLPDPTDFFTIQPISGFSTFEPAWIWIEGVHARAGWRASHPTTTTIEIALRAYCPEQDRQSVVIKVNGQPLASHEWIGECWQLWDTTLVVAPDHLRAGWNTVEFEAASASQPYLYDPANPDQRKLSVMVERLRVRPN
ncbi:MAG: hypothetical protein RMN25_07155 [Anaerolineae bacterium]|nr:hypothetical protein [Thermoflexales bacterium]MDW8407547.1 hypothetical protein [Anaerolineae bacterium]